MIAPTLHTERLTLRMPRLQDFEAWADFFASPRSAHEGGPKDRLGAWQHWAADVALWALKGYGPFGVDDRATGTYLGEVGIYHGEGYPAPELGWFVVPEAEGKGVALEAARAVLDWGESQLRLAPHHQHHRARQHPLHRPWPPPRRRDRPHASRHRPRRRGDPA